MTPSRRPWSLAPAGGLALRVQYPEPPAGGQSWETAALPHLGSFTVRSKLRSWEASWEPGVPAFSPDSCFTGAGGNLVGAACCPFPTGEGREDGVRGAEGFIRAYTRTSGRKGSRPGGLGPLGSPDCWSAMLPTDGIACDAYPCVAILQVIIIAKLCQSCPGSGLPGGEGREAGEGVGRGWGPFIFSTNCHSQFVGLPLRLLLKTLLTLRGSGRSRLGAAPPPQVPVPLLPGRRPCLPLSMPRRGICWVRAMEADSQSEWFKLRDLAPSSCPGQGCEAHPGWQGWTGSVGVVGVWALGGKAGVGWAEDSGGQAE